MARFEQGPERNDEGEKGGMSRRNFLAGIGALGASVIASEAARAAGGIGSLTQAPENTPDADPYDADKFVSEAKRYFEKEYGITLRSTQERRQDEVLGDQPALEAYRRAIRTLHEELSAYGCPEMIRAIAKRSGFEVRLLSDVHDKLTIDYATGRPPAEKKYVRVGGATRRLQEGRAAQTILNIDEPEDNLRENIHHELMRCLSQHFEDQKERDRQWYGLHTHYSPHPYKLAPEGALSRDRATQPCFLTVEAEQTPEDDEAVTGGWMMRPNLLVEFIDRWQTEKDPVMKDILAAKYVLTQRNLASWSNGKIGKEFWETKIEEGRKEQRIVRAAR